MRSPSREPAAGAQKIVDLLPDAEVVFHPAEIESRVVPGIFNHLDLPGSIGEYHSRSGAGEHQRGNTEFFQHDFNSLIRFGNGRYSRRHSVPIFQYY